MIVLHLTWCIATEISVLKDIEMLQNSTSSYMVQDFKDLGARSMSYHDGGYGSCCGFQGFRKTKGMEVGIKERWPALTLNGPLEISVPKAACLEIWAGRYLCKDKWKHSEVEPLLWQLLWFVCAALDSSIGLGIFPVPSPKKPQFNQL